jgi:hypothetical protein
MFAPRLRMYADGLETLADDMGRVAADPWLQHAAELRGAVARLRELAEAISTEATA